MSRSSLLCGGRFASLGCGESCFAQKKGVICKYLLVTPVIVLDQDGGSPFFILLLSLLPPFVGPICFLDDLGSFVQFPLLTIC